MFPLIPVNTGAMRRAKIRASPSTQKERVMLKKILVPTDGSELSRKAIDGALEMASRLGASLVGVTVTEPYPYSALSDYSPRESYDGYNTRVKREASERLSVITELAEKAKVRVETEIRSSLSPYEEIIATAKERGCDSIFMASHGRRGLTGVLLGSETHKVLTHSTIPVMVFR
jgi:nucleotide-binding universal stress UspA family protein